MPTYKTPGVYVEELSTLPPSVAEVATAIPAFIGYTEKGPAQTAVRINTLLDFEEIFGGPQPAAFTVSVGADNRVQSVAKTGDDVYRLYYALSFYFQNGGGSCYIISTGDYSATPGRAAFTAALNVLSKEDEPTLIVLTDAVALSGADYYTVVNTALQQCNDLKDRFTIVDTVKSGVTAQTDVEYLREKIVSPFLQYGAAYYPYLQTVLNYAYKEEDIQVGDGETPQMLPEIKASNTSLYNAIKAELAKQRMTLPPSAAIAGVYATTDRNRGVWKAPANVGVVGAIAPTVKLSDQDQESLNIDPTSGKSVNAIRSFPGKGILVWGARTLAGNDNEWRYVPVRRLFNMIEESTKKASNFAVFEPNDAATWIKVKAMLESYLYGLWQQGALAGPSPEAAYFVEVGLGKTMTTQDVLEGKMIVRIGVAAVRPAEFIVLQFSHKLQEA